jgi:hypothetical protein
MPERAAYKVDDEIVVVGRSQRRKKTDRGHEGRCGIVLRVAYSATDEARVWVLLERTVACDRERVWMWTSEVQPLSSRPRLSKRAQRNVVPSTRPYKLDGQPQRTYGRTG